LGSRKIALMICVRRACLDELPKLAAVEPSAASLFRQVGFGWIADGDTMEPVLLRSMCREGTVDDAD
jgi:hypothetical protein